MDTLAGHVLHTRNTRPNTGMGSTTRPSFSPSGGVLQTGSEGDARLGHRHARRHQLMVGDIAAAHTTHVHNSQHVTQVPVFTHLLRQIQHPQADIIHEELSSGFRLMGQLQPGTNWYVRTDQKYLNPKTWAEFAEHDEKYTQKNKDRRSLHAHARRDCTGGQDGQDEWSLHPTITLATPRNLPEQVP